MRWWHQLVAVLADAVPGGVATLGGGLVTVALLTGVLWYYWPAWLPRGQGPIRGLARRCSTRSRVSP